MLMGCGLNRERLTDGLYEKFIACQNLFHTIALPIVKIEVSRSIEKMAG